MNNAKQLAAFVNRLTSAALGKNPEELAELRLDIQNATFNGFDAFRVAAPIDRLAYSFMMPNALTEEEIDDLENELECAGF